MKALIFCNGEIEDYKFTNEYILDCDLVICCDGGLRHAHFLGIMPDIIMGDFDSVDPTLLEYYEKKGCAIEKFHENKDFTDTEAGIEFALEKNADEIFILGGVGSRFDHSLSNIHLLLRALEKGVKAKIANEKNEICLTNNNLDIYGKKGDLISILPLAYIAKGVTTKGLLYPLDNATLKLGQSIGVSNVLIGKRCKISVEEGILIIIKASD